jgi:hypothetical protein
MVSPTDTETISITTQIAYNVEVDFDFMVWEYSTDGGTSWTALPVYSDGSEITVYGDMSGNNPDHEPVLNGSSSGWITATASITPGQHTGADTWFRFRYFTDAGFQEEGIYLDNISIDGTSSGNFVFDNAESGDTWTHFSEGVNDTKPWRIFNGTIIGQSYYLVEWRNAGEPPGASGSSDTAEAFATAGFDLGLNRSYWIAELTPGGGVVRSPFFENTPGMVVWYDNGLYGNNNIIGSLFDDPSWGAKGRVLVADANPDPFVVGDAGIGPRQVGERRSSFDGAYTLNDRPGFDLHSNYNQTVTDTVTSIPEGLAKPAFRDRIGTAPGLTGSSFIDYDAGVVLPTVNQVPYWAYWDVYGDLGNPGLNAFGVNLEVVEQAVDGTWAKIKFWLDDDTVFQDTRATTEVVTGSESVTYTVRLKDASGSRYSDDHQHIFGAAMVINLPDSAHLVTGSLTVDGSGVVGPSALAAAASQGIAIPPGAVDDTNIVWVGELGGNRLGEPDAVVSFALTLDIGCFSGNTNLYVAQAMIEDTFRNDGNPFLWPKNSLYTEDLPTVCTPRLFMPLIPYTP